MSRREPSDRDDLVFALCHEVGNLLAATRMHTHTLDLDSDSREITQISETINELCSRIGSMLAQIRPLLSRPLGNAPHIDPLDVLDGLQRGLEESCAGRVRFDLKGAVDLPHAAFEPDPLHHVLLTVIYQALEDSDGQVRVSVTRAGDTLRFAVRDESPPEDLGKGVALRGKALATSVADAILEARGGRLDVTGENGSQQLEIVVPIAPD